MSVFLFLIFVYLVPNITPSTFHIEPHEISVFTDLKTQMPTISLIQPRVGV